LIYRCIRDCRIDPGTIDPLPLVQSRDETSSHKRRRKADLLRGRLDVAGVDFASTLIVKTVIVASQLPR